MVLLPKVPLNAAHAIAERIRTVIAASPFELEPGHAVALTVSIGVSEFGRDGSDIDAILRSADERLYRAKHEGRNRVIAA